MLAFFAGVVSVSSPCVLPLIPGFLSYISGMTAGQAGRQRRAVRPAVAVAGASAGSVGVAERPAPARPEGRVMIGAVLFVAGFAATFTALGATASVAGSLLAEYRPLLLRVTGVFVILMGLSMLGILRIPWLMQEKRFDMRRIRPGPAGAFPLGMAFGLGWTPCVGPILAGILSAAAATNTAAKGAGLLAVYSLGMGVPFLAMAVAYTRAGTTFRFLRRHSLLIERVGGLMLVALGLLLLTGYLERAFAPITGFFQRLGWPPI